MLTADLVNARRRGRELRVTPLDARSRGVAVELAASLLEIAERHVGLSRDEFEEACTAVKADPRDRRLALGIRKLVEDRCEFDVDDAIEPEPLRRELFLRASVRRRDGVFDRAKIVEDIAMDRGMTVEGLESALYCDLRGAHVMKTLDRISPAQLVDAYDLAQEQAVLLRAERVTVEVECRTPGAYRRLFHKVKFLRLLHTIRPLDDRRGYQIEIDGPFSLFESTTKYGLQLALVLPVLRECVAWRLDAGVRWGKARDPLAFHLEGGAPPDQREEEAEPRLTDEVATLLEGLRDRALTTYWRASPATVILNLPGVGLCVPDLVFEHAETREKVYLEVLGFWSRAAVWRRVELVEGGLGDRILFAVSKHLRVSEEVLGDDLPGALYIYKRVMGARMIIERIEALGRRQRPVGAVPA